MKKKILMTPRSWLYTAILLGGIGLAGIGFYWFKKSSPIVPYKAERDRAFVIDLFKKNWNFLISEYSPDYDVGFMLDRKSPTTRDERDVGRLILRTYVVDGKPAGFLAYYTKKLKIGQLLFLVIDEKYRGRGYARQLIDYALEDMKKRGMLLVRMNARVDNARARKIYESVGFKKIWTDGAYMLYEYVL